MEMKKKKINSCMCVGIWLLTDCTVSMYAFDAVSGDQTSFIFSSDVVFDFVLDCVVLWGLKIELWGENWDEEKMLISYKSDEMNIRSQHAFINADR